MNSSLRVDGVFYLSLKDDETEEKAESRFLNLLESVGIEFSEYDYSIVDD